MGFTADQVVTGSKVKADKPEVGSKTSEKMRVEHAAVIKGWGVFETHCSDPSLWRIYLID